MQGGQGRMGKKRRKRVESVKGKGEMKVEREKGGSAWRKHKARRSPGGRHKQGMGSPEHRRFIFKSSRCLRVK